MTEIIDASRRVGADARALRDAGVRTVFRYYTRDSASDAQKRLHPEEARQLLDASLKIGAVYEGRRGNQIDNFDRASGTMDGTFARTYANHIIGQPAGSAIYFAVDTDANAAETKSRVIPYFEAVRAAMSEENGEPRYAVGVYGSGATCIALLERGLVDLTWLAMSTGWRKSKEFAASGKATMIQKHSAVIGGVGCDPDVAAPGVDVGDFVVAGPRRATHLLAFKTAPDARLPAFVDDRPFIPKLIELGSSEAGLATARKEAAGLIPGYPTNGCAAHLYALLSAAGVDAKFSPYAGRMAWRLEQRGWRKVNVGEQRPGDVGVTLDRGPPDGADHVYLVIEALADNEMFVADNQNSKHDAPHRRFATKGHGKTETDYFLRG